MTPDLHCRLATRIDELAQFSAEWDRLAGAHPRPQAFYSWAWHHAAWLAYDDCRELCAALVFRGETLCGVLPVASENGELLFFSTPHADYCDLLCEPVDAVVVLACATAALDSAGHRVGLLRHLPEDSLLLSALDGFDGSSRQRWRVRRGDPCPTLIVEDDATLTAILKKKSLRRHENGLRRRGELEFERVTTRAELIAALPDFFKQHTARRALAGDQSLFHSNRARRFYDELVAHLDPATTLHFSVLRCGDGVAAYHLGFLVGGCLTWYKPTIDVDLWDLGPGEVLIKRLVELIRDEALGELDFTRGQEAFKQRFTNRVRQNFHIVLDPPGLRGAVRRWIANAGDAIRSRPRVFAVAKRTQRFASELVRVLRRHGPVKLVGKVAALAWRRCVFARDEVVVFHRSKGERVEAAKGPELEIELGSLADLAACAVDDPEFFDGRRLQNARKRIKDGSRLVIARVDGELAHVAWLAEREKIVATEVGTEISIDLPDAQTVIYDCWTPSTMRGRGVYPVVLQRMVELANTDDVWIYCHAENRASWRGIEKAGFRLRHRMMRVVRFGRQRRSWTE